MKAITIILFSSIAFQLGATVLALRLISVTGRKSAWLLIAAAVLFMTVRRIESLLLVIGGASVTKGDVQFELVGLLLSSLMCIGMWRISPIFHELAESREKFCSLKNSLEILAGEQKILLDYSVDFIYRHDLEGNITYASPAVERITGFATTEWQGHYTKFYTDNPLNEAGRIVTEQIVKTGKSGLSYRIEVRHKNGALIWLEVNKQAYLEDGRVVGVIGVARDITNRVRLEAEREKLVGELQNAMAKIKTLKGMLPICASCKKIRDDEGYWKQIESYIREHTDTEFTHSICPECVSKLYPEFAHLTNQNVKKV